MTRIQLTNITGTVQVIATMGHTNVYKHSEYVAFNEQNNLPSAHKISYTLCDTIDYDV